MNTFLLREVIRKKPGQIIQHVPMPQAEITEGLGTRKQIGTMCKALGYKSVLLVTDKTLYSLGYHTIIFDSLKYEDISCTIFNDIASEPNIAIIEAGREAALGCKAQCIIALGGGSVMDSCKMIAAATRLKKKTYWIDVAKIPCCSRKDSAAHHHSEHCRNRCRNHRWSSHHQQEGGKKRERRCRAEYHPCHPRQ